jgi:hypothetical protein
MGFDNSMYAMGQLLPSGASTVQNCPVNQKCKISHDFSTTQIPQSFVTSHFKHCHFFPNCVELDHMQITQPTPTSLHQATTKPWPLIYKKKIPPLL